jgi:hypothetical protein
MEGASADARKYHGWMDGWMDWLDCFKNLPFDCVDDFDYQKYSNLGTASSKTIKKYMKAIQQIVKTNISENQSPFSIWSYFWWMVKWNNFRTRCSFICNLCNH